MVVIKPQTLKGFRDFLPTEARKRQYVIDILKGVFQLYGFEPLETPALEYEEILLGKYGEEGDKLMYRFEDNGKRRVALRYDQTVPLARVVAQYVNQLPMPFKRYQIQPVWRAENTQKGRFREFLQCDIDTIGINSPLSDAEIISCAIKSLESLGFKNLKVLINDRTIFIGKPLAVVRALDKLKKIGYNAVIDEIIKSGLTQDEAAIELIEIERKKPTQLIQTILTALENFGADIKRVKFSPTLARGLDYYTGVIFEIEIDGYTAGSIGGGGRYDKLIGMFTGRDIPAVGFAFGFDRLMEAMEELNLFPSELNGTKVLVTIFPASPASQRGEPAGGSPELKEKSIEISSRLRANNINTELYLPAGRQGLDETASLDKQLKYASQKGIPYVIIIGPEEIKANKVTLKNMQTREQQTLSIEELTNELIK